MCGYIDDWAITLTSERSMDMFSIAILTNWLEEHLLSGGEALNRQTLKVLMPGGFDGESLSQDQQSVLEARGLTVSREGMQLGVSIGTSDN